MLDVETALARANAAEGLIDADAARAVEAAGAADDWDAAAIERAGVEHASPVVPLAARLRERAGDGAHVGATSQDVLDTAAMLVAARALAPLLADAARAADAAAALAAAHRDTPVLARTLLQAALPTSFGLKAAGWMRGIDAARTALVDVRLPVQMGGPVGHRDPAVASRVAADLGLAEPVLPWSGDRTAPAALACALGVLCGALAKPARDVVLLAQTEVGEAREGGDRGRSSAMAHKRNPVAAVSVLAAAQRAPGLVATMLGAMAGEHERAAGAWQAERATLTDLLDVGAEAAAWTAELLAGLEIEPGRMAENLRRAGVEGDLGASSVLIDRALRAHEEVTP